MKKLAIILSIIMIFNCSVVFVGALAPPYSKFFDTKEDMLNSLADYSKNFPNISDYNNSDLSASRPNMHIEYKNVILPQIKDAVFSDVKYGFGEATYGSGVNYLTTTYINKDSNARFVVYYQMNEIQIKNELSSYDDNKTELVHKGTINETDYVACEKIVLNDEIHCEYKLAINDCIVNLYTEKPFDIELVKAIKFESIELNLPVFVKYCIGDVDLDKNISITDATYIQLYLAKLKNLDNDALITADTDTDGSVTITDATMIQLYLAKLIEYFG